MTGVGILAFLHGHVRSRTPRALGPQGCSGLSVRGPHSPTCGQHRAFACAFCWECESLAWGMGGLPRGRGGGTGGGLSSLFFPGGLGSGNSLRTILPSASTGDSFTVIPGLEGQVTSPLSPTQGEAYDGRYGILRGDLPGRLPAGRFGDLRSLGMFGDPQDVERDGFEDARDFVPKIGGGAIKGATSFSSQENCLFQFCLLQFLSLLFLLCCSEH
jgi:hypothetical protein